MKWKTCFSFLMIISLIIVILSVKTVAFIGPTETVEADMVEYVGVDKSQPDTPKSELVVDSDGEYAFIKIDLSRLPPIDGIFVVSAYLDFRFSEWSAVGELGYASVAIHYCDDNSWTNSTLTWNNKPGFREKTTDTWGFSFIYFGDHLGFNIEVDVNETLKAGAKLLTEVITWGSGSGHTRLSNPKMTIIYTQKPVYSLFLDVECDASDINITETPFIRFSVGDQIIRGEILPKSEYASPRTYNLEYKGGCKFISWQTTGGVSVTNVNEPFTEIIINSEGGLTLKCSLDWIIYKNDEEPSEYTSVSFNSSDIYTEKYIALIPCYIRLVRLYIMESPQPFELHILGESDDPTSISPIDITTPIMVKPEEEGWLELDLSSQQIKVEKNETYYISITWLSDKKPVFAGVMGPHERDVYSFKNNNWEKYFEEMFIQHIISTSLEEPVDFQPYQPSPTPTVKPTPTIPPTPTPTASPIPTLTPTPSPTNTSTPAPKPTTPIPTLTFIETYSIPLLVVGILAVTVVIGFMVGRRSKKPIEPQPVFRRFCPNCGSPLKPQDSYCGNCGAELSRCQGS